jgi:hypothetical protein
MRDAAGDFEAMKPNGAETQAAIVELPSERTGTVGESTGTDVSAGETRTCLECKASFSPGHALQKYCSDRCRLVRWKREHANGRPPTTADTRIKKLISEKKELRAEIEKLKAQVEAHENARLEAEQRIFDFEKAAKDRLENERTASQERRLLAFRAMVDLATQSGIRGPAGKYKNWDEHIERVHMLISTPVLEEILAFKHAPQILYLLSEKPDALRELSAVPLQTAIRFLVHYELELQAKEAFLDAANSLTNDGGG